MISIRKSCSVQVIKVSSFRKNTKKLWIIYKPEEWRGPILVKGKDTRTTVEIEASLFFLKCIFIVI